MELPSNIVSRCEKCALISQSQLGTDTWTTHNGDGLSNVFAGAGALNTSFTQGGKPTFAGRCVIKCIKVCC
ncbi:uncharacterized protein MELLADRAFT_86736 [Melampsora larici-populina 98AG31]|uniref:Uncharacterized protein n=1 Tax=Melampsora larici-populina (strain 98AG31 / pathotype 3-4-7) TaxID=747676 RepID=F4R375_MELLP|nr:uncharacterized protein MELLADRAFT_86736 [Melampsora larici-populina 98AG31]EGG13218.1 hypothetical protein MELLADRAFT_86736 [Melampsora larici-populina 98AG31]